MSIMMTKTLTHSNILFKNVKSNYLSSKQTEIDIIYCFNLALFVEHDVTVTLVIL